MKDLLERFVRDEVKKMELKDKMTGFLVKRKKRGTFQALEESRQHEEDIKEEVSQYVKEWLINELTDGKLKKVLLQEIDTQIRLELSRKGFVGILKV